MNWLVLRRSLVSSLNDKFDLLPSLTDLNQCSAPVSENTVTLPIPTPGNEIPESSRPTKPSSPQRVIPNRKYNVVLFGVDECGRGTSRFDCQKSDLDKLHPFFLVLFPQSSLSLSKILYVWESSILLPPVLGLFWSSSSVPSMSPTF